MLVAKVSIAVFRIGASKESPGSLIIGALCGVDVTSLLLFKDKGSTAIDAVFNKGEGDPNREVAEVCLKSSAGEAKGAFSTVGVVDVLIITFKDDDILSVRPAGAGQFSTIASCTDSVTLVMT